MLPNPIHPAIVHFPIVLSILLPAAAIGAVLLARRGLPIRSLWVGVTGLALLLAATSWLAVRTGESQEENVEAVVTKQALETHEEGAERFLLLAGATLVLTSAGLLDGRIGRGARVAATLAAVALPPAGYLVGHSGGELVYRHGAAAAYVPGATAVSPAAANARLRQHDD